VARARSSGHQTQPFKVAFERSWSPLHDGVANGPELPLVRRQKSFFFHPSLSLNLASAPLISFSFTFGLYHFNYYIFIFE